MKTKSGMLIACLAISLVVSNANAKEEASFGQKAKNFWNKLWGYPARLTEETASVVVDTTKNTTDVVSMTAKNTADIATGKVEKSDDLLVDPVMGSTKTVGETAKGLAEAPIEAAQ